MFKSNKNPPGKAGTIIIAFIQLNIIVKNLKYNYFYSRHFAQIVYFNSIPCIGHNVTVAVK